MSQGEATHLTDREARLLKLLATGHTIKSAIAITGDTEAAAHELLRSARRKLGVSSSREAARIYAVKGDAQKKCHDLSVIETPSGLNPSARWLFVGGIMFGLTILAIVLTSGAVTDEKAQAEGAHVESTLPVEGAQIEPGPFVLRVTFDRPMIGEIKSVFSPASEESAPLICQGPPILAEDGLSFEQLCIASAGAKHQVWFGHSDMGSFRSEDGHSPDPHLLTFTVAPE